MNEELTQLIKQQYQVEFKDTSLLDQAFTHSSYVNEHRYMQLADNERLEFLGDAVLELVVSEFLYGYYQKLPEGKLTKLRAAIVCEDSLAKFAKECQFDQYIRLGKGEENSKGRERPSLLCDLFESFLGALYLDQGLAAAEVFVSKVVYPKIKSGAFSHEMDHKTALQEILQKNGDVDIAYRLVKEEGPAHDRQFSVEVSVASNVIGTGVGKSKKVAEQRAAEYAIVHIKDRKANQPNK
ncbi:ribonuclease III [Vagococcus salmoninarum]|uniref:ribonuclease III n=1 Tax=Vagococcus salmoninarum TaxID=2739 RepID=UPI003F95F118